MVPTACVLSLIMLELIPMLSALDDRLVQWVICLPLFGWRRRAQAGKTSSQGGESSVGVFGAAWPPQRIVPEGSTYSRGPSVRMDLAAVLIHAGRGRWVRQAV